MAGKLVDKHVLMQRLQELLESPPPNAADWHRRLKLLLDETQGASREKLRDRAFLRKLFDGSDVSATGMCTIKIDPAIENDEFVEWFAEQASRPLPKEPGEIETYLGGLHQETMSRFRALCGKRPSLKINRALCALFPDYFTTIADEGKLRVLYREMGGSATDYVVHAHIVIRRTIDELLGPYEPGSLEGIRRMCLPWMLYQRVSDDKNETASVEVHAADSALKPLPAALRRKGLTAIKGYFQTLLSYLTPLDDDGLTYNEFCDVIRQANPALLESSTRATINVVMREFDLCRRNGDIYQLSARGINLLESQDPEELADQLLTKVLGVDYTIRELSQGAKSKAELIATLKTVNPGWTTDVAPTALLGWLLSMEIIHYSPTTGYSLTDAGHRWDELITWEPPKLAKIVETVAEIQAETQKQFQLPEWSLIQGRLNAAAEGKLRWDAGLVEQLHAGLWSHPIRHLAVMAGLSGSGKTQLALHYGHALCGAQPAGQEAVKVIPIQPGWFDTSPLLGYVHPIQQNAYVGTPFLDLVLRAADNPTVPYVAILDEMNLSHPEQYLAPILSAMETNGLIELHQFDDEASGIPSVIQYPTNLAIIGTVNADETTHGLSDKVLDRAFTLEFWDIDAEQYPKWSSLEDEALRTKTRIVLQALMTALAPVRQHFGWRTIDDVVGYLVFSARLGVAEDKALDDVLYAKVLPKLRGENSARFGKALFEVEEILKEHQLGRCRAKVAAMREDLDETGAARFWR